MFYIDDQGTRYRRGKPFNYNGYYYGTALATDDQFEELGFRPVIVEKAPDGRFWCFSGPDNNGQFSKTARELDAVKAEFIKSEQKQAYDLLSITDWYVTRQQEINEAIPASITSYRASVRSICDQRRNLINACSTIESLEALINEPLQLYNMEQEVYYANPDALPSYPNIEDFNEEESN